MNGSPSIYVCLSTKTTTQLYFAFVWYLTWYTNLNDTRWLRDINLKHIDKTAKMQTTFTVLPLVYSYLHSYGTCQGISSVHLPRIGGWEPLIWNSPNSKDANNFSIITRLKHHKNMFDELDLIFHSQKKPIFFEIYLKHTEKRCFKWLQPSISSLCDLDLRFQGKRYIPHWGPFVSIIIPWGLLHFH